MHKIWLITGSISALISVAAGAFGAHALAQKLDERLLSIFKTAAQYQMYHSLGLIALGLWAAQSPQARTSLAGWCFTVGIAVFSGSLYALALTDVKILGAITPIGGVLFMLGWLAFAYSVGTSASN